MDKNLIRQACRLLTAASPPQGPEWRQDSIRITPLTPDGSLRRFCRIIHEDGGTAVVAAPPADDRAGLREAVSGWKIGQHLFSSGAPVPELYSFDEQSGLLVCEDLGDQRLHDLIQEHGPDSAPVIRLYKKTVAELAKIQVRAGDGFDTAWCWDTPQYDRDLMLKRESGYFLQALCRDLVRLDIAEEKIQQEFIMLAEKATRADASFFLHRDFQSRNIMVRQDQPRFIDYQAGRLGPLAYDLASLLIDPYAALPRSVQDALQEHYLDALTALIPYDREQFHREYLLLALQRNLQILGAFAFLSRQRGKPFFQQYITPALHSLQALLAETRTDEYPYLTSLSLRCAERLETTLLGT